MKRIFISVLALGVCLTPLTVPLMVQPSWGQSQDAQVQELQRLIQQARQQRQQGQNLQAIETFKQILDIARAIPHRQLEGVTLLGLGKSYFDIHKLKEALDNFNKALLILREVDCRFCEATTLNNIGGVYHADGQMQKNVGLLQASITTAS